MIWQVIKFQTMIIHAHPMVSSDKLLCSLNDREQITKFNVIPPAKYIQQQQQQQHIVLVGYYLVI